MTSLRYRPDPHGGRRQHPARGPARRHPVQRPRHPRHLDRRAGRSPSSSRRCAACRSSCGPRTGTSGRSGWHPALADKTRAAGRVRRDRGGRRGPAGAVRVLAWSGSRGRPATACTRSTSCRRCCPTADVVVLVLPLTDDTRGLVDAAFLARMKDGALLVNVARGAGRRHRRPGRRADVRADRARRSTWSTRSRCPRTARSGTAPGLLISPHVGGASSAMWPRAYRLVRDQLHRYRRRRGACEHHVRRLY